MFNRKIVKIILIVAIIIVVPAIAGVLYSPAFFTRQNITEKGDAIIAELVIDYGGGMVEKLSPAEFKLGENLFDFTKNELTAKNIVFEFEEYKGLGKMVTKIGDKKNNAKDGYWQYWINGEYASVGAADYLLKPGDKIEWRFSKM